MTDLRALSEAELDELRRRTGTGDEQWFTSASPEPVPEPPMSVERGLMRRLLATLDAYRAGSDAERPALDCHCPHPFAPDFHRAVCEGSTPDSEINRAFAAAPGAERPALDAKHDPTSGEPCPTCGASETWTTDPFDAAAPGDAERLRAALERIAKRCASVPIGDPSSFLAANIEADARAALDVEAGGEG